MFQRLETGNAICVAGEQSILKEASWHDHYGQIICCMQDSGNSFLV